MAEIQRITDMVERMKSNLPTEFKDLPNWEILMTVLGEQFQVLLDDVYNVEYQSQFSRVVGANIDHRYGAKYGVTRKAGEADDVYKARIIGELLSRVSDGSSEGLRKSLEAITGMEGTNYIGYHSDNVALGGAFIYGYGSVLDEEGKLTGAEAEMIQRACSAGINDTVFGIHPINSNGVTKESLFIPCELGVINESLIVVDSEGNEDVLTDLLDEPIVVQSPEELAYGDGWESAVLYEFDDLESGRFLLEDGTPYTIDTPSGQGNLIINTTTNTNVKGVFLEIAQYKDS